jgi:hypothetical protein
MAGEGTVYATLFPDRKKRVKVEIMSEQIQPPADADRLTQLEESVAALGAKLAAVESRLPKRPYVAAGRLRGRRDRVQFGYQLFSATGFRLRENRAEQQVIDVILEAAESMGPRAIARYLDAQGCRRRGKSWQNGHSLIVSILDRLGVTGPADAVRVLEERRRRAEVA